MSTLTDETDNTIDNPIPQDKTSALHSIQGFYGQGFIIDHCHESWLEPHQPALIEAARSTPAGRRQLVRQLSAHFDIFNRIGANTLDEASRAMASQLANNQEIRSRLVMTLGALRFAPILQRAISRSLVLTIRHYLSDETYRKALQFRAIESVSEEQEKQHNNEINDRQDNAQDSTMLTQNPFWLQRFPKTGVAELLGYLHIHQPTLRQPIASLYDKTWFSDGPATLPRSCVEAEIQQLIADNQVET